MRPPKRYSVVVCVRSEYRMMVSSDDPDAVVERAHDLTAEDVVNNGDLISQEIDWIEDDMDAPEPDIEELD